MPGFDGTGPSGQGALTGRGLGPCGRGIRRGFRGYWGRRSPVTLSKEDRKKILEAELEQLDAEKEQIKKTLEEL